MRELSKCPVCQTHLERLPTELDANSIRVRCGTCGPYVLEHACLDGELQALGNDRARRAILSHGIRRMARASGEALIGQELVRAVLKNTTLPRAAAQLNNLLLFLADELVYVGVTLTSDPSDLRAVLGSISDQGVDWVVRQAMDMGYVESHRGGDSQNFLLTKAALTMKGWMRVEELKVESANNTKAFMAMKFGDAELDRIFSDCFKPAAKRAGFDLVRLDDAPRAGLIDDRLRLEIRTSRFLIADLTHANAGAYWEAGMAEGLGKPVIYSCRQSVFDDPRTKPHFDTNHYLSILWDSDKLSSVADRLVDTIRVTLPSEANLVD